VKDRDLCRRLRLIHYFDRIGDRIGKGGEISWRARLQFLFSEPIRDGNVLIVIVIGPCTTNVWFRQSGSILISSARCVPGT